MSTVLFEVCAEFDADYDDLGICARCGWLEDDHNESPVRSIAVAARRGFEVIDGDIRTRRITVSSVSDDETFRRAG